MKYANVCNDKMTFQECELAILRAAVDKAELIQQKNVARSPEMKKLINIVENFIRRNRLICYGGTAINNILPKQDQFYNKDVEIPDYDFFSPTPVKHAKQLADIYAKNGFGDIEAKAGVHYGTYKVFVNFIPVADITYIPKELFYTLKRVSIQVDGILYAPPNYLRMAMYLELSRPAGDVSRWEKVLKRLILLNKNYYITTLECDKVNFQRPMEDKSNQGIIYKTVENTFIDQGCVFIGGYALSMYSQYMPKSLRHKLRRIPDFDVISEEPEKTAQIVKERLVDQDIKHVVVKKHPGIGEIIAPHYEIKVGKDTIAFVYEPIACHSYNIIKLRGFEIKIATIDTLLSFFLAFLYADRPYYDPERIVCMAQFLFEVQERNRLEQKGLLKRFSLSCIGHQQTLEEIKAEKSKKYKELKDKQGTKEYDEWFLRYVPGEKHMLTTKNKMFRSNKTRKNYKQKAFKK
jgi:Poly(A) polymerase catalytic subunit